MGGSRARGGRIALATLVAFAFALALPSLAAAGFAPVDHPGPDLDVPADQLAASLTCTPDVKNAKREPVILLPATGVDSHSNFSWNYEPALKKEGIPYCTSNQAGSRSTNLDDIQVRGYYIAYAIRRVHELSGRKVALSGHSQGGMVSRWALRFWPDTRAMVDDVIGMAGSNHGSDMGGDGEPSDCAPANCQQSAKANFIKALNSGQETFDGVDYTEIYTHRDEVVTPNDNDKGSSSVHGPGRITNVALQDICPADPSEHLAIGTTDATAWALFLDALTHDGPANPKRIDSAVCTQQFMPGVNPATFPTDAATAAAALETAEQTHPTVKSEPPLLCYVTATCPNQPRARIRLQVRRRATVGRRTRFRFLATAVIAHTRLPIKGAQIRFAGRRLKTDRKGRATLTKRLGRARSYRASVTKAGLQSGRANVEASRIR